MVMVGLGVGPLASVLPENIAFWMCATLRRTRICPLAAAAAMSMLRLNTNALIVVTDSSDAVPGMHAEQSTSATPLAVEYTNVVYTDVLKLSATSMNPSLNTVSLLSSCISALSGGRERTFGDLNGPPKSGTPLKSRTVTVGRHGNWM